MIKFLYVLVILTLVIITGTTASFSQSARKILEVPYYMQDNGPDCWAASLLMITSAVSPKTDNNILKVVQNAGEQDGIATRSIEGHSGFIAEATRRTGIAPRTTTYWSGTNTVSSIAGHIKRIIDNNRPVMFCSTNALGSSTSGHCLVIVGYDGDNTFYVNDPIGYANNINQRRPYSKIFTSNASYAVVEIPKDMSANRNLVSARIINDAITFIKPKTSSSNTTSISYKLHRTNPDTYVFIDDSGSPVKSIASGYDVLSLEEGSAFLLANSSNSSKTVKITVEIQRKDKSKKLKTITMFKTLLSSTNTNLGNRLSDKLSIYELRDKNNTVDCEMVFTFSDTDTNKIYHKDTFNFKLEPDTTEVKLKAEQKQDNLYKLEVTSDNLPDQIKLCYTVKHSNIKPDEPPCTTDNPFEYRFVREGYYSVSVKVYQLVRTRLLEKQYETKEFLFGEAETRLRVDKEVNIKYSEKDGEYSFEATSNIPFNTAEWKIKDFNTGQITALNDNTATITHKFTADGYYDITVLTKDPKDKPLAECTERIEVKGAQTTDQIDEAFKNRDYKTILKLISGNKNAEQVKKGVEYLHTIADEFLTKDKALLEKFVKLQREDYHTFQQTYEKYDLEKKQLSLDNKNGKNNEAIASLNKCLDSLYKAREEQKTKIEDSIKAINEAINALDEYYSKINPDDDITKELPQVYRFDLSKNIKSKLEFDPDKTLEAYDYKALCIDDSATDDDNDVKVTLKATKKNAKANERVSLTAKIENAPCSGNALKLSWSNNAAGISGFDGVFVASTPGSYSPAVSASCNGKSIGSSSISIKVTGGATGQIIGLEENQVFFGSEKLIKLQTDLIKPAEVDNSCKNNPDNPFCVDTTHSGTIKPVNTGNTEKIFIPDPDNEDIVEPEEFPYLVRWDSNRNLTFDPQEIQGYYNANFNTRVTFDRIENPVKIWAEILQYKDGSYETIGESDLIEIEVIPPQFSMIFDPTQDRVLVGEDVTVAVTANPHVKDSLIDYRWVEPTSRKEISNGKISFNPKDTKTVNLHVIARVPHYGDVIDDNIKDQFTPGEHLVTARLIGPKFDQDSQEWSTADRGLVTKKPKLVTGQAILADVTTQGIEKENINYEWSSNEGCSIDSVRSSDVVTVSRSTPGVCTLSVIARNKDKNKLGSDEISFSIEEQDSGLITPPDDKTKEDDSRQKQEQEEEKQRQNEQKQQEEKKKEANEAIKAAEEEAAKGNFEEAVRQADKAAELDPDNTTITETLIAIKEKQKETSIRIEEIEDHIKNEDFEEAKKEIAQVESNLPGSSVSKDLKEKLSTAKNSFIQKSTENSKANIKKGQLEEAIKSLEKASQLDPDNKELKDLLTKTRQDKQKISGLNEQFQKAMNEGDYVKADKILKEMKTISHYDPEVQSANTSLSKQSFTKRAELTNELNNINKLAGQGNIEQAISKAETLLTEAQKVNYGEGITADARSLLNDLKNKKSMCDRYIAEAERLIAEGYYDNAKTYLDSARTALPKYKPVLDLEAKLNEIFNKRNAILAKQKELIQQANDEIRICNYDQAADLANQAKALNPDNKDIEIAAYNVNNKHTIFMQDVDRARLLFDRGDIDLAKKELTKHASYCSDNSAYIAVNDMIDNYYQSKNNELAAKIAELKALLNAREYTKVSDLAKEVRSQYSPIGQQQLDINELESQAIKKLSNKKGAINYFNIAQTHFIQYNYEGCLKQLDILDNQYPDCWEPSDEWPDRIAALRADAREKLNRVNILTPQVKKAVESSNLTLNDLKKAYEQSLELCSLSPNDLNYSSYRNTLQLKLSQAEQRSSQEIAKAYSEFKKAEDAYNLNKLGEAVRIFGETFEKYDSILDKNDPQYKHYKAAAQNALSAYDSYEKFTRDYNDVLSSFEGEFDIKKLNKNFLKRLREAIYTIITISPNKQLARQTFGNQLETSANQFENLMKQQIDQCKIAPLSKTKNEIIDICTLANQFDPDDNEVQNILKRARSTTDSYTTSATSKPSTPSVYSPPSETKISDNGNIAGCGFTDTARFAIQRPSAVNKIEVWYKWEENQTSLPYLFHEPSGNVVRGVFTRTGCDPYQKSWCTGSDNLNKVLQPGNYAVTVQPGRICQNSGTGGNGTIRVYAGPFTQKKPDSYVPPVASSQAKASTPYTQTSGAPFDGHYRGTCRIYSATGNCTITLDIKNNSVSGAINATIEGDNVTGRFSGKVTPPGPQYSQASAPVNATITSGTIKDNTLNTTVSFTGKLKGTVYTKINKASGDISIIVSGSSGGPKGEWQVFKQGTSVSTATSKPVQSAPKQISVIFQNYSSMPVHFYAANGSCAPNNKVLSGGRKQLNLKASSMATSLHIGRNGQTIGTINLPLTGLSNGQQVYLILDKNGRFYRSR